MLSRHDARQRRASGLWWVAQASAVVVATVAAALLLYLLVDILLLLFLGIVVAAAVQPLHSRLCGLGVPKALAVLLIYGSIFVALSGLAMVIGPALIEQATRFAGELPATYASFRLSLQASTSPPLRLVGRGMPTFEQLTLGLMQTSPDAYGGLLGATTSAFGLFVFLAFVLVVGVYWTLEVPRIERLLLSYVPLAQRPQVLNTWHEMERKLGAAIRVQALTMLAVGVIATVGYLVIGLEGALALGVIAGLLEAIPLVGPTVAVTLAVFVALPQGVGVAVAVLAFFAVLQFTADSVIVPRLMRDAVGVSPLVSLLSLLAFGTLYGIFGAFIAVPMTAMIQVLLESDFAEAAPVAEGSAARWAELRLRLRAVREQARERIRGRDSRMGIDPASADHVVDVVDQQIEGAAERIEGITVAAAETLTPRADGEETKLLGELESAVEDLEQAVGRLDKDTERRPPDLDEATEQVEQAVERAEVVRASASESPPAEGDPDPTISAEPVAGLEGCRPHTPRG